MLSLLERYRNLETSTGKSWRVSARAFSAKAAFNQKTGFCQKQEALWKSHDGAALCWDAAGISTCFCFMPNRPQGMDEQLSSSKPPNIADPGQPHLQGCWPWELTHPKGRTTLLNRVCGSSSLLGSGTALLLWPALGIFPSSLLQKGPESPGGSAELEHAGSLLVSRLISRLITWSFSRSYIWAKWEGKTFGTWKFLVSFHGHRRQVPHRYINKAVACKTKKVVLPLCSALVRAQQRHCVHFLAPVCTKCVDMLEGGQRNKPRIIWAQESTFMKKKD